MIAAIDQLNFPLAVLVRTNLEVFASSEALERSIIGVERAGWQTLVGDRLCKAFDAIFAGATRKIFAVLAPLDELVVVDEDINCRQDPCSEKVVATFVDRLAFAFASPFAFALARILVISFLRALVA